MLNATLNLLFALYIYPLFISMTYFTLLKIEDINKTEKLYSKDKFSYPKCIEFCLIPIVNIIIVVKLIQVQFIKD